MPKPYTDEALLIVAIERLRSEVAALPLAIAVNHARYAAGRGGSPGAGGGRNAALENEIGGSVSAFDRPQAVIVVGPRPLPVTVVGGGLGGPPRQPAKPKEEDGASYISRVIRALVTSLETMLGPVAVAAAIIGSAASGASVMVEALNVFASSVAPILLPVTFSLATALVAASDAVWGKLQPALEEFDRFMLKVAVPAIRGLVDVVATLTQAFIGLTRLVGPNLSGAIAAAVVGYRYGGAGGAVVASAYALAAGAPDAKEGEKPFAYYTRQRGTGGNVIESGASVAGATIDKMWKGLFGGPSEEAKKMTRQAQLDTLAELRASMGSMGGVGSITGNWAAAQNAAANMTPFQVKVLQRLDETITALTRGMRDPASAEYT